MSKPWEDKSLEERIMACITHYKNRAHKLCPTGLDHELFKTNYPLWEQYTNLRATVAMLESILHE